MMTMGEETWAGALAVNDPRRPAIGRAMFSTLWAAALFSVCTGPAKQIKPLYDHAPWLNDPFDTVVSFAMFFVPLIALCCLGRVLLCRRSQTLPSLRVVDLLRGCRVVLAAIALTLLSEWSAVAVGANRSAWDSATWLQTGLLVGMTALLVRAGVRVRRASARSIRGDARARPSSDWLSDLVLIARWLSLRLGPWRGPVLGVVDWIEGRVVTVVRRHPLWAAGIGCSLFGVATGVNQGIREGYDGSATLAVVLLLSCGMFGLVVASGYYLGLVRSDSRLVGVQRRVVDSAVLTCFGVLVPFAFRGSLWWIIGTNGNAAGVTQLAELLGVFAVVIFAVALTAESLFRLHPGAAQQPA
jgi:hypothetical protein